MGLNRQAVELKQILRRCSGFGKKSSSSSSFVELHCSSGEQLGFPMDVPRGHFVAYVGKHRSRYVVPISLLTRPGLQTLLQQAADEFGCDHSMGLIIPCAEHVFLSLIK